MYFLILFLCFFISIAVTPFVIKFAYRIGAVDRPGNRKIHKIITPRLGGLSIYIGFVIGSLFLGENTLESFSILIGSFIIVVAGIADDVYDLSPKVKLLCQTSAALVVSVIGEIQITVINMPWDGQLEMGFFSIPATILWIVGITNAINLVDGLDGLAAGISSIALVSISVAALLMGNTYVLTMGLITIVCTIGFLHFNFHPAKIFLGDTGSMFLGYIISVLALLGFKNITVISLIAPIIILGVPISDTFFSIIRRLMNKESITKADMSHLHHCLLKMGYSHRETVILIYAISALFGLAGIIVAISPIKETLLIVGGIVLSLELLAESVGLIDRRYRPLLNVLRFIGIARNR